jgi:hypothetical protein
VCGSVPYRPYLMSRMSHCCALHVVVCGVCEVLRPLAADWPANDISLVSLERGGGAG